MEYIDIVDENGKPTGRTASRDEIHKKGLWYRTVHIWLMNDQQEILLQKRALNKESHPGLWDISCAGHISAGETTTEAAIKELKEELGILAETSDLKFLFSHEVSFSQRNGKYIDNEIYDTYILLKNVPIETIKIQIDEIETVKYISFVKFKEMVTGKNEELVQHTEEYMQMIKVFDGWKEKG